MVRVQLGFMVSRSLVSCLKSGLHLGYQGLVPGGGVQAQGLTRFRATKTMENQMDKQMGADLDTGFIHKGFVWERIRFGVWGTIFADPFWKAPKP